MFTFFIDKSLSDVYQICNNNDVLIHDKNNKLQQNKSTTEITGNCNLELKTGLSLFPMDWLNNSNLPVWSAGDTASSNNQSTNLTVSNLPNSENNLPANLTNQSNSNQLNNFSPISNELASLNPNIYSSLISQNYLIPFLKNAALLANLANSNGNNSTGNSIITSNTVNSINLNSTTNSINSSLSSLSGDQWTGQNQENEISNKKSINSIDCKNENYQGK